MPQFQLKGAQKCTSENMTQRVQLPREVLLCARKGHHLLCAILSRRALKYLSISWYLSSEFIINVQHKDMPTALHENFSMKLIFLLI